MSTFFSTRENLSSSYQDTAMIPHNQKIIINAAHKLAYMKMMREQAKNTPSLSADDAKYDTIDFFNSKIRELEAALVEERRQKMITDARQKLLISITREELNTLLSDARGEPRYSCTLRYSYGAGKTPMKDYKSFHSSKEISNYISRLVEAYPGIYPKDSYILPTSSFIDEMFSIAKHISLDINKEQNGTIPLFEINYKLINY
jgi:hypothetical protein